MTVADLGALLPLRAGGGRPPLFCLHPGFALGWTYAALLRHVGRDQPLYAIQARGLIAGEPLPGTYAEMVADYLALIRSVRPHGPYRLLGWSLGGLVAHSIATELQAAGERVELLAMLDTVIPAEDDHGLSAAEIDELIMRETERVRAVVPDEQQLLRVVANLIDLREQFTPRPFHGDLLLVTAAHEPGRTAPLREQWLPWVTGTIRDHHADGAHMDMMSARNAREIGGRLVQEMSCTAASSTATTAPPSTA